jgi:hypothetical protein
MVFLITWSASTSDRSGFIIVDACHVPSGMPKNLIDSVSLTVTLYQLNVPIEH